MTEPKRIHRMPPCSQYEIAKTQAWIEDMAAKGWHLEKDGYLFGLFSFIQDEPKSIRCRLEATDTNGGLFSDTREPTEDARKLYEELGWHWLGRRGQFQIYITDDPAAPELHTDPRVQAISIKALTKYLRNELGNTLFSFFIHIFVCNLFMPAMSIAALGFWPYLVLALWVLEIPVSKLRNVFRFYRMRKALEQGAAPETRKDYRRGRWLQYLNPMVNFAILVFLVCSFGNRMNNSIPLEDWTEPLPFATLQELFPGAEVNTQNQLLDSHVDAFGDWFTPENYEYSEYATVTLPDGTRFTGSMYVLYHETKYDWFALSLAKDHAGQINGGLMDRLFMGTVEITPLTGLDCDYAVTWYEIYPYILICKDNHVLQVRYHPDMEPFFTPEELAQILLDFIA